ncbi:hypothetical protein TNCV_11161 [Trichonephila clavipes]|nr:hypothetical protein TNCV_11161 [Trichonephila clavipes]
MFAIAAISSRQTIVNKYLQNNKGVNWNGLTVDDFVVVVFVVGFVVVVFVVGFVVEACGFVVVVFVAGPPVLTRCIF